MISSGPPLAIAQGARIAPDAPASAARASWRALGTSVHVLVTEPRALDRARDAVDELLRDIDQTYSRFRSDSELSLLNASPDRDVAVSPLLLRAVEGAIRAAQLTSGAVDPTVGRAMRALGYDRDFVALLRDPVSVPIRIEAVPGWRAVRLDPARRTIRVRAGVELDLGSTGKALAADLAARAAAVAGACGVLVSLGGDIATAGDPPPGGWRVLCAEDSDAPIDGSGEVIAIHGDAMATSSTTVRRWTAGGAVRHHIVDPWTGLPANGPWRTATVVAGTAEDANTAATAAIVLGARALEWLAAQKLPARLVAHDGTIVRIGGWPEPLDRSTGAPAPLERPLGGVA